jgi:hypothetical protein
VPRWEFEAAAGATIGFFAVREGLQLDFWGYFFEKNDGNIMAK